MMNSQYLSRLLPTCLLSVLLVACSATSKQPQWLDNPSANHPSAQYLTAIGEADKREAAGDRALANLAKIFEVAIKEKSMDFSSSEMISTMGTTETRNEQRVARYVSTEARQVLEGADVVEYWQDEQGQVHALATLNKSEAARRFNQGISDADRQVNQLVDYASHSAPNPISALTALEHARTVQTERDNLNRNLGIVSNQAIPTRHSGEQLENTIREALATLKFAVNTDDEKLLTELQNAIATLGIQYDPQSTSILSGKMDAEPAQQKQGWYWLRGSYELSLTIDGTVIEKRRWPFKVSATDNGMVEQRAKDEINSKMPNHVYELLSSAKIN